MQVRPMMMLKAEGKGCMQETSAADTLMLMRSTFIQLILGTDMKMHFPLMSRFQVHLLALQSGRGGLLSSPILGSICQRAHHRAMLQEMITRTGQSRLLDMSSGLVLAKLPILCRHPGSVVCREHCSWAPSMGPATRGAARR